MPGMNLPITVIKRNLQGEETWRYTSVLTSRTTTVLHLEAPFNGPETPFMGMFIKHGDRFLETYFMDRWYNIFQIHDRDDGMLKGWYCNIGKPALMEANDVISYVDLALDLWVAPDGMQTVMDEDEFAALDLDAETRQQAWAALEALQKLFADNRNPGLS
jgi:predicted RNA-binding protein associated with RNAse of E/G family